MRMRRAEFRSGFTFIELMVVLVVMIILARLVYPSYLEAVRKAKRAEGRAALLRLMQQQELYFSRHNSYIKFSFASTDEEERRFTWYSGNTARKSAYELKGEPCANETIRSCVLLTAKAGTENVDMDYKDPVCGAMTMTSSGTKTPDNSDCWK